LTKLSLLYQITGLTRWNRLLIQRIRNFDFVDVPSGFSWDRSATIRTPYRCMQRTFQAPQKATQRCDPSHLQPSFKSKAKATLSCIRYQIGSIQEQNNCAITLSLHFCSSPRSAEANPSLRARAYPHCMPYSSTPICSKNSDIVSGHQHQYWSSSAELFPYASGQSSRVRVEGWRQLECEHIPVGLISANQPAPIIIL